MSRNLLLTAATVVILISVRHRAPCLAEDHNPPPTTQPNTQPTAAYKLDPGPFKPKTADLTLHDKARNKDLPLKIHYPADADGSHPLIIFSHGMGGSNDAFPELTRHWAGHGYIVILPTHSDSLKLRRQRGEKTPRSLEEFTDRKQLRNVNPIDRLDDARFILDSLQEIEKQIADLRDAEGNGRIDRERIGIAGHSAGAYTTQLAIGVKARTRRNGLKLASVGDERFKAAILISGQGLTNRTLDRDSWSDLSMPMLVITGSRDTTPITDETPESRQHPYDHARPGDKYLVFLEGATHSSFSGKDLARRLGEARVENPGAITDAVASSTLAFWDAYLRSDAAAREYLQAERIEKLHQIIRAEHK